MMVAVVELECAAGSDLAHPPHLGRSPIGLDQEIREH